LNLTAVDDARWQAMEQHVGLLHLTDVDSGKTILCAPSGDTAGVVEQELRANEIGPVNWQTGRSLVSLIGSPALLPEMDAKAARCLGSYPGRIQFHECTPHRSTFVVAETEAKTSLAAVYEELRAYLGPSA
ncbi:MAG TPA: hypothetical protein VF498_14795, partial [Anaerolineales bacterium]